MDRRPSGLNRAPLHSQSYEKQDQSPHMEWDLHGHQRKTEGPGLQLVHEKALDEGLLMVSDKQALFLANRYMSWVIRDWFTQICHLLGCVHCFFLSLSFLLVWLTNSHFFSPCWLGPFVYSFVIGSSGSPEWLQIRFVAQDDLGLLVVLLPSQVLG